MKDMQHRTHLYRFRRPRGYVARRGAHSLLKSIGVLVALVLLINLLSVRFVVQGESMQPTLDNGNLLIVSRLHYALREPQAGDIAVFRYPDMADEQKYIKRIIAGPGDVVELRAGQVYVNGIYKEAASLFVDAATAGRTRRIWQVGQDEYFVLGDNRSASSDSRSFGPVPREFFIGPVILRYWPLT